MHDAMAVVSSWVKSIDWANGVLTVTTKHNKVYRYAGVPEFLWRQLQGSPSKGEYINNRIKGKYPTQ
jgi:hypothetical protein